MATPDKIARAYPFSAFGRLLSIIIVAAQSAAGQGLFLEDNVPKVAKVPTTIIGLEKPASARVTVTLDAANVIATVSPYIYGQNANVYMTQMVDQPQLLGYLRDLLPNVIRFPGGNLSSIFFWNAENGSPPDDAPADLVDAQGNFIDPGYWYGKNSEAWTLSVDNYYEMLGSTNNTGMITINYGYARYSKASDPVASAAHLAAEWVRYDNGRTKFWEIGNESNGSWQAGFRIDLSANQDGQPEIVSGDLYGAHFRVFADSMRKAAIETGATIYIGAQLLAESPASWWSDTDRFWNHGVFSQVGNLADYFIVHSYYTPYATNSKAIDILRSAPEVTVSMMNYLQDQQSQAGIEPRPIALTEWNIFAEGLSQMASYINGMHSVLVLAELIRNRYGMAARWDLANGWNNGNDHGIFNQGDEPGNAPKWNPRPAYYYMTLFQRYFGDEMVNTVVNGPESLVAYGSRFSSGETSAVIVNTGTVAETVRLNINNAGIGEKYYVYSLTGGSDNGEFSLKVFVNGRGGAYQVGGPSNLDNVPAMAGATSGGILVSSPARSVQFILVEQGDNQVVGIDGSVDPAFEMFPNPAGQEFYVRAVRGGDTTIELVDGRGILILTKTFDGSSVIPTSTLPKGLVVAKIQNGGKVVYKKLVIR